MSNKKNNTYKKSEKEVKPYKNPTTTIWGKIIICTLALLMALSGLIALIIQFFH